MNATTTKKIKSANVMVPVSVTLLIPVPRPDAAATGDNGRSFARDLLADLQLTLGGVPVTARPAST